MTWLCRSSRVDQTGQTEQTNGVGLEWHLLERGMPIFVIPAFVGMTGFKQVAFGSALFYANVMAPEPLGLRFLSVASILFALSVRSC
jgi:hypothetical protein